MTTLKLIALTIVLTIAVIAIILPILYFWALWVDKGLKEEDRKQEEEYNRLFGEDTKTTENMNKEERVKQAKILVAEQLSNMIVNDIVEGNGFETFKGWCESGLVFDKNDECYDECVRLMNELDKSELNNILWKLALENKD